MTILENIWYAIRIIAHGIWTALKAIFRGLWWLLRTIVFGLGNFISWTRTNLSPRACLLVYSTIGAIVVVLVALVVTGHGCSIFPSGQKEDTPKEEVDRPQISYSPKEQDLKSINYSPGTICSFSLVENGNQMYPELTQEQNSSITRALSVFETDEKDVAFLFMNLKTGSGICYNIDERIYGASTYKAPLSVFLCEEYIDGGLTEKSSVSKRIEDAIVWSDNEAYRSLKHGFDGSLHNEWLSEMGLDDSYYADTFPKYSVRDAAALWVHVWKYLNSESGTAEWLKGLFERTETSFIRDAAARAGIDNAAVYNKGGWCVSDSGTEDAVNDAGIVVDRGNVFLVVAFSNEPEGGRGKEAVTGLLQSLLEVRYLLDASNATWENTVAPEAQAST